MQRELKQYSKAWYEKMQMIWRDRLDAMNIRKPKLYMDTSRIQEIKFTTPSLTLHTNLLAPNANIWYAPTKVSCTILNDRCVWGSLAESTRNHREVFHQPVYFPRQEQMEIILIYRNHIISRFSLIL